MANIKLYEAKVKTDDGLFAFCGIGAIIIALPLSIANIPDDYSRPGTLSYSGAVLTLGLLIVPALRITKYGIQNVFRAEHFLMLAIVYWLLLDLLQTSYPLHLVNKTDIEFAFVAIAVFAVGNWIGIALPTWRLPSPLMRASRMDFGPGQVHLAIWVCFFLGTFNYFFQSGFDLGTILSGLTAPRWDAPWTRGSLGDWNSFLEELQYFSYALPSLTVILADRAKSNWLNYRVLSGILLSCIFLAFQVQIGGRRIIGIILGAALLTWFLLNRRLSFAKAALIFVMIVGVVNFLQTILLIRTMGLDNYIQNREEIAAENDADYIHVDDNFLRLAQIVNLFPEEVDYVGMKQIVYVIVRPIPRAIWPDKPLDPGYSLSELVGMESVSLTTSIVGELYATWGLTTVLFGGIFLGSLAKSWNSVLRVSKGNNGKLIYALGIMVLFVGVRSMNDLVIMSYSILAWTLISLTLLRRGNLKIPYASVDG